MSWKDKAFDRLLMFYRSIGQATNASDLSGKSWHRIGMSNEFVVYDQSMLVEASACLLENKTIEDNYSQQALSQLIANRLTTVFAKEPEQIRSRIDSLLRELSNASPEIMNVFMSIQGVTLSRRMKIGAFEFLPAKEYEAIENKALNGRLELPDNEKNANHVMVSVSACESGKAKEKAYAEFQ